MQKEISITLAPEAVAVMCMASGRDVPEWAIAKLGLGDRTVVEQYNRELATQHWHLHGIDYRGHGKSMAFGTEAEADAFADVVWHWETGGDEDNYYKLNTTRCVKPNCRVYVG